MQAGPARVVSVETLVVPVFEFRDLLVDLGNIHIYDVRFLGR